MSPTTTLNGPDLHALRNALNHNEGLLWRVRPLRYPDPFDDTGSRTKRRGRYHVTGLFGALYFATTFPGALLEFVSRQEITPVAAVAHYERVRTEATLDLTSIDVRRALVPWSGPIDVDATTAWSDLNIPNGVAALALGLGADSLIAPSAAFHRLASAGVGVEYTVNGVTQQEQVEEFYTVIVLRSATHAPVRDPIEVAAVKLWLP